MDCLRPGDVAILATPPAFRWVHFGYAIQKGLNVFMEKPVTVDGPTTRKMLSPGRRVGQEEPQGGRGPHVPALPGPRQELHAADRGGRDRRADRPAGLPHARPDRLLRSGPKPAGTSELLYQIQRFHSFLWASGGCFSDFNIHSIDECCWMKNAWPVQGPGPRRPALSGRLVDQNFDNYSVEYTFADGTKLFLIGRCIPAATRSSPATLHGTKGLGHHFDRPAKRRPSADLQGPQRPKQRGWSGITASARPVRTRWNGTT